MTACDPTEKAQNLQEEGRETWTTRSGANTT